MTTDTPQIVISDPQKIDAYTLQVRKDIIGMRVQYTRDYLIAQRDAILADIIKYQAARQVELDEITQLLAEMDKLGIVQKQKDQQ